MAVHLFRRRDARIATDTPPAVAPDERIYAIGDVHGRYDLLIRLLERLYEDAMRFEDGRRPRFVFLGDVIDRGEDSKRVLKALLSLNEANPDDVVTLLGNHEAALLEFLNDPLAGAGWLDFGGLQTLASLGIAIPRSGAEPDEMLLLRDAVDTAIAPYRPVLDRARAFLRSGDVFFCHAGLDPARPLDAQETETLVWGHPRFLSDMPMPGLRVVHGHFDAEAPVLLPGRICVDTGAYYSDVLTAVRLDEGTAFISTGAAAVA